MILVISQSFLAKEICKEAEMQHQQTNVNHLETSPLGQSLFYTIFFFFVTITLLSDKNAGSMRLASVAWFMSSSVCEECQMLSLCPALYLFVNRIYWSHGYGGLQYTSIWYEGKQLSGNMHPRKRPVRRWAFKINRAKPYTSLTFE